MIIRPSLPSHGPVSASSRVHTCISRRPIPYSPPFCGTHAYPFHPPSCPPCPPAPLREIVYGWKLEVPRCPAAVRGVSWQKCNAAYHKICPRWSPRMKGGEREGGLHLMHKCTVWFGSTRQERLTMKEFRREEL